MAIQDGVNGLLVPVRDVGALSDAMQKIIASKDFSDHLSKNAVQIRYRWDIETIAKKWLEVIET